MRKHLTFSLALAAVLTASACGSGSGSGGADANAGGTSVAYGSERDVWAEAFADVDPIDLRTQSSAAKDSPSGADWQAFIDHIEEFSDGKITFDVGYANAYADAGEADKALVDGRLDLAQVITQYQPEEFTASNDLISATVNSEYSPVVGNVASNLWPNEVGFGSDAIVSEFEDRDLKLLLPYYNTGAGSLFCSEETTTVAQLHGAVVGASGSKQTEQLQIIGASPTSMAFTEFFESLQRGAIDCVQTTPGAAVVAGIGEVAPHAVIDPEHAFIAGSSSIAMSAATWESLPLPAQQLIYDSIIEFVNGNIAKNWDHYNTITQKVTEAGGGVNPFNEDVYPKMEEATAKINGEIPADLADASKAAADHWKSEVENASLDPVESFDELDGWLTDDHEAKVREFIQTTAQEQIFADHRPE